MRSASSTTTTSAVAVAPPAKKPCGRRRHKHKPGDEALCKYASKACYQPRVVKKTGELHRYCDHHRQQANRNQRRLEQRRRLKDRTTFTTPSGRSPTGSSGYSVLSYSSDGGASDETDDSETTTQVGEELCSVIFEPYRQPVALRAEDLSSLRHIFAESPTTEPPQRDDAWTCQL